jgi:exopolysaccharide biosynthesis polyprenyl glycosylphosphotransferase
VTPFRRKLLLKAAKLYDLAIMTLAFGLAAALVAQQTTTVSLEDFLSMRIKIRNFVLFTGFLIIWHTISCNFNLYDSRRLSKGGREILDTVKATILGAVCLCVAGFLFKLSLVTPAFLAGFWLISSFAIVASRLLARQLLSRVRVHGRNLREMVIVGTNCRAVEVARKIESKPALGYRILGFVDDPWEGTNEFLKKGYRLVSDFSNLPFLLREQVVDEVLIALPMKSLYLEASRIAALCDEQGITTKLLPNFFDLRLARFRAEEFEGMPVITLRRSPEESWQHLLKRVLDVMFSLVAIATLAPLGALAALLVKLTSPGKVFFVQERVGINKRRFRLYKFRTMVADAERRQGEIEHLNEVSGPVFKIKNDPRITRVGRVLRKTSIDELPQLFNVLKGDMSLVGPRPLPVRDYAGFSQDWQRRRFSVRPGITCLWQVNGRNGIPFDKWMELDMQYIDDWSLGLDFKILAKTIPAVVRGSGAA